MSSMTRSPVLVVVSAGDEWLAAEGYRPIGFARRPVAMAQCVSRNQWRGEHEPAGNTCLIVQAVGVEPPAVEPVFGSTPDPRAPRPNASASRTRRAGPGNGGAAPSVSVSASGPLNLDSPPLILIGRS